MGIANGFTLVRAKSLHESSRRTPGRLVEALSPASKSPVIARLDRAIQYAAAFRLYLLRSGILDPRLRGDDDRCKAHGLWNGTLMPC